jgi:TolB-like protein/tetratricopeptide (TPR) repeat protein
MSPGGDQKWLADSTAEELIDALSRIEELRVIARTSAFAHRGQDIATIGERLQVGAVVEGSLRRSGNQLRITAQLIRVADSSHLWSGSYTRKLADVFAIQHEVAVEVAEAVRAELGVGKTASWLIRSRYSTPDVRAWELLRKGLDRGRTWTEEGLRDQIALSVRALEIDPGYADAHAQRAWGHLLLRTFGYDRGEENLSSARNAAERALELDPGNGRAHHLLAVISLGNFDWGEAETRYVRALEAAPGDGALTFGYGNLLVSTGRIEEAAPHLHRAVALDPELGPARFSLGNLYFVKGDYEAAIGELEQARALSYPGANALLSYAYHLNGDDERAVEAVIQIVSSPEVGAAYRRAFDEAGYAGMVRASQNRISSRTGRPCTNYPFYASFRFAIIGEPDRMFECWEIAIRLKHEYAGGTREHPPFDRYRDDPRFTALLREMNLAD